MPLKRTRANVAVADHLMGMLYGRETNPILGTSLMGGDQFRGLDVTNDALFVAPFGTCPHCGSEVIERQRKPYGNDTCSKIHIYPSHMTIPPKIGEATAKDETPIASKVDAVAETSHVRSLQMSARVLVTGVTGKKPFALTVNLPEVLNFDTFPYDEVRRSVPVLLERLVQAKQWRGTWNETYLVVADETKDALVKAGIADASSFEAYLDGPDQGRDHCWRTRRGLGLLLDRKPVREVASV